MSAWFRIAILLLFLPQSLLSSGKADEADRAAASRLLTALVRNPRFGTTFDRVLAWHTDRGSIRSFRDYLLNFATRASELNGDAERGQQAKREAEAGNTESGGGSDAAEAGILTLPPGCPAATACLLAGMVELRSASPESAAEMLSQSLQLQPRYTGWWYLGRAQFQLQAPERAITAFEEAIEGRPVRTDLMQIFREYARGLQRCGRPEDALQVWTRLEQQFPEDRRILQQIAGALAEDGRWNEALLRYQRLSVDPDPETAVRMQLSAAEMLVQLGREDEAVEVLSDAVEGTDSAGWLHRQIRSQIEQIYRGRDDLAGLTEHYRQWLERFPDDVNVISLLGIVLQDAGQRQEAVAALRRASRLAPRLDVVTDTLLQILTRQQQLSEAEEIYRELVDSGRMTDERWQDWGTVCLRRSDLTVEGRQEAIAEICRLMAAERPDDAEASSRAAALARRAGASELALEYLQRAMTLQPDSAVHIEALGDQLFQMGRRAEAVNVWNRLVSGGNRNGGRFSLLATIFQRHDLLEEALQRQRESVEIQPDFSSSLQLAEMLERVWSDIGTADGPGIVAARREQLLQETLDVLQRTTQLALTTDQADAVEQRQLRVLLLSNRLDSEIVSLQKELEAADTKSAAEYQNLQWRLTGCLMAAGRDPEAVLLCRQMLQTFPESLRVLSRLLEIHESAGRTLEAMETLTELSRLDGRHRVAYLQRLSRLQLQMGQTPEAVRTAELVTEAAPGAPASWQFLADLAFEAGNPEAAIQALQRSVRLHPDDETALAALAATMAEQLRTAEAIDLYWKALESTSTLGARETLLVRLTQLALRGNLLDDLYDRLERRSRLSRDEEQSLRELAIVQRESGSLAAAAETLEQLLVRMPGETGLIEKIVELCERRHDRKAAEYWQLQLWQRRPQLDTLQRLLRMSGAEGDRFSAGELLNQLAEKAASRHDIHSVIQLAVEVDLPEVAVDLCLRQRAADLQDWWVRDLLLELADRVPHKLEAELLVAEVLAVGVDLRTTAAGDVSVSGDRLPAEPDLLGSWARDLPVTPESYGDACARALDIGLRRLSASAVPEFLDSADVAGRAYGPLSGVIFQWKRSPPQAEREMRLAISDWLAKQDGPAATALRLFTLADLLRGNDRPRGKREREQVERSVVALYCSLLREHPDWLVLAGNFDAGLLITMAREELITAARDLAETGRLNNEQCTACLQLAADLRSESILDGLLKSGLLTSGDAEFSDRVLEAFSALSASALFPLITSQESALNLTGQLLDCFSRSGRRLTPGLLTAGERAAIRFRSPIHSASAVELLISALLTRIQDLCSESTADLAAMIEARQSHADGEIRGFVRAELFRQRGDEVALLTEFTKLQLVSSQANLLRLWFAERLIRADLPEDALRVLAGVTEEDPQIQIAVQRLTLETSLLLGRREAAEAAANRLTGLPLNGDGLSGLLPVLDRAGFETLVKSLEIRLGRGTETRVSALSRRLQTLLAEGNRQLAGEAAWEILRLSSGGSLFSGYRPNDDLDDGGERLRALQVLGDLGRLQLLVQRYEVMLQEAPDSLDLLEVLCELYEASGQTELLRQRRDRILTLTRQVPEGRKTLAVELEQQGDVAGACEIYLDLLTTSPAEYGDQLETFYQAFERADLRWRLVELMLDSETELWRGHGRLLISAAGVLGPQESRADLAERVLQTLLEEEGLRRLAIAASLNQPDLISAENVFDAICQDIRQFTRNGSEGNAALQIEMGEIARLLERVRDETMRSAIREFLSQNRESLGYQGRALELLLDVHAEDEPAAKRQLDGLLGAAAAEIAAGGDVRKRFFAVLSVLQERIGSLEKSSELRQLLLEFLVSNTADGSELQGKFSIELASLYDLIGERRKARDLLLGQTVGLLRNGLRGEASDAVRRVLQTAEQIQHSGYPIEAAGLLGSVTDYELQRFSATLGEDKAIAFRSRWNASRRWSERQLTTERLLEWMELQTEELLREASSPECSLLIEFDGSADPGEVDPEELRGLRLRGLLPQTARQSLFAGPEQLQRFVDVCSRLTGTSGSNGGPDPIRLRLVLLCLLTAEANSLADEAAVLRSEAMEMLAAETTAVVEGAVPGNRRTAEELQQSQLPTLICVAAELCAAETAGALAGHLLERCLSGDDRSSMSNMVRLAVLNESLHVAGFLGSTAQVQRVQELRDELLRVWGAGSNAERREYLRGLVPRWLGDVK